MNSVNSVIRALYNGDVRPGERSEPAGRYYRERQADAVRSYEKLLELLETEKAAAFRQFMDKFSEVQALEMEQNFSNGFRLGARLMCAVFMEGDSAEGTEGPM